MHRHLIQFQSRYRAASHFRSCGGPVSGVLYRFQSRYRAASHFRLQFCNGDAAFFSGVVSISLSSGFSFQEALDILAERRRVKFQSRYRAASHFSLWRIVLKKVIFMFQSRYRAASHFSPHVSAVGQDLSWVSISLSSGFSFQKTACPRLIKRFEVSISLSSGFSFQVQFKNRLKTLQFRFNLVIERLFISGADRTLVTLTPYSSFNLVIERLFISGQVIVCREKRYVFQSRYRAAFHFRIPFYAPHSLLCRFNLVIERLFISGTRPDASSPDVQTRFNLVIERLFISGRLL